MATEDRTPDPVDVAVGARIRIRRRHLDQSQGDLAKALGITFQQVQKYERGFNRVSASMLVKTAAKLETTVGALVGEDGAAPVEPIVMAQLGTPGASDLLIAFAGIRDGDTRRALLTLAQAVSGTSSIRMESGAEDEPARPFTH